MLLTAVMAALVSTAIMVVLWYLDTTTPPPLDESGLRRGPGPHRSSLIVAVGAGAVSWLWLLSAVYHEQLMSRIESLGDRLDATANRLREEAEQDGVFRGMDIERSARASVSPATGTPSMVTPGDPWSRGDEPTPDDEPPTSAGGGRIIRFPS
jgi:hypothetical protein